MKKSKPPDQKQGDYKNKPFKSLKGFVPSLASPTKKRATPLVRKKVLDNNDDEASLFFRAVEGAKRFIDEPDARDGSAARQGPEKTKVIESEDSGLFLAAMQKIGTSFRDALPEREIEDSDGRSSTSRMRQLKRGTIRVSRELDLHGFLRDEAIMRLERFVADACSGGQSAVLVITGKGINSPEGPVLKGAVAEWLATTGKALVAEFSPAPRELGGSGAFVVFLKKHSS